MKCLFCLIDMSGHELQGMTDIYSCKNCSAQFYYVEDDGLVAWKFFFSYKNKEGYCEWFKGMDRTTIGWINFEIITTLEGSSMLNPNNILQKIPTILVFS